MSVKRATLLVSAILGILPSILPGQDIPLGNRIRVTAPSLGWKSTVGTFQGLRADSLRIDSVVVPLRSISLLEVSRGTSSAWGRGLGIGLLGGVDARCRNRGVSLQ